MANGDYCRDRETQRTSSHSNQGILLLEISHNMIIISRIRRRSFSRMKKFD